ncbi:MAG: DUF4038 domain-containing protein [Phycisphaerae bacterium]|nr:DUF4038 domain-containing protein [Phycisphaerae bacterium]
MKITAQRNRVTEIHFRSTGSHSDPYNDVALDVLFRGADGDSIRVPAYWAGDDLWCVRFAADRPGCYEYASVCSRESDFGLHGQTGAVTVEHYAGGNPLYRRGRLRVADDQRHFEHADGTPFFWIGDTWWMGLTDRVDWPSGFKMLAADRAAKGFSVIQIIAGPLPDMDAWDPRGRNEAGFPFREGFGGVNPAYFDHADLKIGHLVHAGLVPCIVGMWGYYLPQIGVERIKRFWRYLVARYGAYPVVWCIAGEGKMPYYLSETREQDAAAQLQGWTEVTRYVRQIDPFGNLITIHPTQFGREQVEEPSLLHFEMLQTGHGGYASIGPTAQSVMTSIEREPRMPVIVAEVNYEGILGGSWQDVQRLAFYTAVFNGTAGHTYGANGLWQASTADRPYGPSPHGRCYTNTSWQEVMALPGSRQIGLAGEFMARFPWWQCVKHPEWIEQQYDDAAPNAVRCIGIPRRLRLVYVPMLWDPPTVTGIEPGVGYRASYFDPCTGDEHDLGPVNPDAQGTWRPPFPPEVHDWIVVLEGMHGHGG